MNPVYTNRLKLPEAVFDAICNDPYDKGGADFSVTELLKPPRQRALQITHKADIQEDAADRLWSLYGQLAHALLERANKNDLAEKRFFLDIDGDIISGQIDTLSIEDAILSDFKFTSAYGFGEGKPAKPEHIQQLNMQALLLAHNDIEVKELQIIALLRDWQLTKARLGKGYPKEPIVIQKLPIWHPDETLHFIKSRIYLHKQALIEEVECSSEDHWKTRRCRDYCNVNKFCTQYCKTKEQQEDAWL